MTKSSVYTGGQLISLVSKLVEHNPLCAPNPATTDHWTVHHVDAAVCSYVTCWCSFMSSQFYYVTTCLPGVFFATCFQVCLDLKKGNMNNTASMNHGHCIHCIDALRVEGCCAFALLFPTWQLQFSLMLQLNGALKYVSENIWSKKQAQKVKRSNKIWSYVWPALPNLTVLSKLHDSDLSFL